jgi:hypothetical protein
MTSFFCSKLLNLSEHPLIEDFEFPENFNEGMPFKYAPIAKHLIKKEILDQLESLGQEFGGAILFRKAPNAISVLHSDLLFDEGEWKLWHAAINWNLTNAKSRMEWYDAKTDKSIEEEKPLDWWQKNFEVPYFLSGIHYEDATHKPKLDPDKFTLLESRNIQGPTLVRTDIPHRIIQMDNIVRWTLSIRLKTNHSWTEALKIFDTVISE